MRKTLAVLVRDYRHVAHNVIALLICMGLAIMPSLYAWFNIAGSWDPYGNTGQVKVAVASNDEGYTGSIVPITLNVGDRVLVSLAKSDKIDYVVTDADAAVEGVRSGEFYAAVVLPKSFSADLLSALSRSATHPAIDYYVNEKRNAIASIVTGKASGSVQTMVDESFDEAVARAGAELLDEVSASLDDESLLGVAEGLSRVLDNTVVSLRQVAGDMEIYEGTVASMRELMDTATTLLASNATTVDASGLLEGAREGRRQFEDAAAGAAKAADAALGSGLEASRGVEEKIDSAFEVADGQADRLAQALDKLGDEARTRCSSLQTLVSDIDALDGTVYDLERGVELGGTFATVDVGYAHEVRNDLSEVRSRANAALERVDALIASYDSLVGELASSRTDAETARQTLKAEAAQAREQIESLRSGVRDNLSGSMDRLEQTIADASAEAEGIAGALSSTADDLDPVVTGSSEGMERLEESLARAAGRLNEVADSIEALHDRLGQALATGDMDLVRTMLGSDPAGLASFVSSPVATERVAVFPVENNGSAMAPYYTTMALWVGGTLMGILLYVGISDDARRETGARPRHAYFGRLLFFLTIGAAQSTILLLGDLYFLGVQCEHPLLFLACGWVASCVFINIIYALAASFGDVGKAIAVFLMVVQVAGSGGTFPVQMLPGQFQALYPYLPFVHSENAMRAAMFGVYHGDWAREVATLAAYVVPALALGLVLRKPVAGINEWMEEKLEETRLM